jgi:hypothetical protein
MFYKAKIGRKKCTYWIDGPGEYTPNEPYKLFINCKSHGIFTSEEEAHEYVYKYLTQ